MAAVLSALMSRIISLSGLMCVKLQTMNRPLPGSLVKKEKKNINFKKRKLAAAATERTVVTEIAARWV